jgi:hypothetical protein
MYLNALHLLQHTVLRSILIASVASTAAEVLAAVMILGPFLWWVASGGIQEFQP